ncbi:MAG: L-rhamnose mutarotase [Vulcanimicrobiaceae bacterium]
MERVALHTRLKPGKEAEYERVHATISPELDALLRENGVHAWRIFRNGRDLFHYVEVDDYAAFLQATQADPVNVAWQARMAELLEVVHDYGDAESNALPLVWELP